MRAKLSLCIADSDHMIEGARDELLSSPDLDVVGVSDARSVEGIKGSLKSKPDVLLLGTKQLEAGVIGAFRAIRERYPEVGLVLVSASYGPEGGRGLRELAWKASGGCAFLSSAALDQGLPLSLLIQAVAQGRMVIDRAAMEMLIELGMAVPAH